MASYDDGERSGDKTLWIILALVGGAILVCGGGIALLIGGFFLVGKETIAQISSEMEVETAAEEFLDRIGDGRIDAAYRSTSAGFRERQTLEQFRGMILRNAKLKNHQSTEMETESISGNSATVSGAVVAADGTTIEVTLEMVKEGGKWKVDQFKIP